MEEATRLVCNTRAEADAILAKAQSEGFDIWATIEIHPETGKVLLMLPGYTNYAQFGKTKLSKAEAEDQGYYPKPKEDALPPVITKEYAEEEIAKMKAQQEKVEAILEALKEKEVKEELPIEGINP